MHNGDGVVAAVSVHTAEMPNSMAWVSGCLLRHTCPVVLRLFTAQVACMELQVTPGMPLACRR